MKRRASSFTPAAMQLIEQLPPYDQALMIYMFRPLVDAEWRRRPIGRLLTPSQQKEYRKMQRRNARARRLGSKKVGA